MNKYLQIKYYIKFCSSPKTYLKRTWKKSEKLSTCATKYPMQYEAETIWKI